jgi:ankyrin repeat protein
MAVDEEELRAALEEYRHSPDFMFVDDLDVHKTGLSGDAVLHAAVIRRSLKHVRLFLAAGAQVNAPGDLSNTPLHCAASFDVPEIATCLIEHGANPTIRNEFGQTALEVAELMKCKSVAKVLRKKDLRKKWRPR